MEEQHFLCHLCGKHGFAFTTMAEHLQSCKKEWLEQQKLLPSSYARKEVPSTGPNLPLPKHDVNKKYVQEYNRQAEILYKTNSINTCMGCLRIFTPLQLVNHLHHCKPAALITNIMHQKTEFESLPENELIDKLYRSSISSGSSQRPSTAGNPSQVKHSYIGIQCYLCGREFGSKSITIHQEQCIMKWSHIKSALPKEWSERLQVPPMPEREVPKELSNQSELSAYNEEANEIFLKHSRIQCPDCNKLLNIDSISHHIKICPANQPTGPKIFSKPKTIVCYLCGREYGSKSLSIHQKHCLEAWKKQQEKMPMSLRKDLADPPSFSNKSLDQYNEEATLIFNESVMYTCKKCNRRFVAERIIDHEATCRFTRLERNK